MSLSGEYNYKYIVVQLTNMRISLIRYNFLRITILNLISKIDCTKRMFSAENMST